MAKLRNTSNQKVVIVVPILLVILLAGFLTYSFANFKSIKTLDIIGSYFIGNSYTLSYNVANCTSKTIKNGKTYGELCIPAIPDDYKFDGWYNGNTLISSSDTVRTNSNISVTAHFSPDCENIINKQYNFYYNGTANTNPSFQSFTALCPGYYQIEAWGAEGGGSTDYPGATGGYTSGIIELEANRTLYIYVGGHGDFINNQNQGTNSFNVSESIFNNGGITKYNYYTEQYYGYSYAGGGSTDIRLINGSWDNFDSLKSRIMVAAGGGGANVYYSAQAGDGYAGGLNGYDGSSNKSNVKSTGGTQISGGSYSSSKNQFGQITTNTGTSNGGNGYYAGGPGAHAAGTVGVGAGGSSFISGYSGCNAISNSSTYGNMIHTNQPNHYSGYIFNNMQMIDGLGCDWSNGSATNCGANQIQPDGSYAVGHKGHGHVRIKYLGDYLLVNKNVINSGTFYNGTHTILSSQVDNSDGFELVGASESGWGSEQNRDLYIRWDIELDLTDYKTLKYNYKKVRNHGRSIIYIRPVNASLNDDTLSISYGNHNYTQLTDDVWYEEEIDISDIIGNQIVSFVGGYTDYSGYETSTTQYSNIRFYK